MENVKREWSLVVQYVSVVSFMRVQRQKLSIFVRLANTTKAITKACRKSVKFMLYTNYRILHRLSQILIFLAIH
jgi:hypothetical protein